MGSSMGGGSTTNQNQNQNSNTNYSGQTASRSILPDWVNQAGPALYNEGVNQYNQYNPINPLVQQNGGLAAFLGQGVPGSYENAASWFGNDRGGGYATTALDRLLAMSGGGGAGASGSNGGTWANPREGIRDVNHRNFTDYDINAYMNPYTQNVVDASLGDLDRQAQIESLRRQGEMTRSGTFGGSRHGVADALAAGENARAAGTLGAQLRNEAYNNAANLIGRDQTGSLAAQTSNQGADVSAAQIAAQERAQNEASASSLAGQRIQGLVAALQGGLNLGGLDLARGGAWQGIGESAFDRNRQGGLDRAQLDSSRFGMLQGLGGLLSGIPIEQGQIGSTSGTQSTQSTMSGRSRTSNQAGANDYLGLALGVLGLM